MVVRKFIGSSKMAIKIYLIVFSFGPITVTRCWSAMPKLPLLESSHCIAKFRLSSSNSHIRVFSSKICFFGFWFIYKVKRTLSIMFYEWYVLCETRSHVHFSTKKTGHFIESLNLSTILFSARIKRMLKCGRCHLDNIGHYFCSFTLSAPFPCNLAFSFWRRAHSNGNEL